MSSRVPLLTLALLLSACSTRRVPAPLSWEFGQDRYLTPEYLTSSAGATCTSYPGHVFAAATLPDSTYFVLHARPSSFPEPWVTLERGYDQPGGPVAVSMILNPNAGIVEGFDRGQSKAYGIRTYEARWLSELGRRALTIDCAAARQER